MKQWCRMAGVASLGGCSLEYAIATWPDLATTTSMQCASLPLALS
jgi:hypothetical protein